MHDEQSPLAGKTVRIKAHCKHHQVPNFGGSLYWVEDWWDHLTGKSWGESDGNPAALMYAMRTGMMPENSGVPNDDEVLYGKIGPYGHLVHLSEIEIEDEC